MATGATKASRLVAGALLALLSFAALAGPDEDYRSALTAFRSGDMTGAMTTLRRTSGQGHVPSMVLLGYIFEQGSLEAEAAQMYRKAAEAGSADGEVALAAMLAAGKGVKQDVAQAVRLYESAAGRGNGAAINALAQAYISGTLGFTRDKRDNARAIEAIERAARQGYEPAVVELNRAYTEGDYGLSADAAQAARWVPKPVGPPKAAAKESRK
jgi:TPR repeat protein